MKSLVKLGSDLFAPTHISGTLLSVFATLLGLCSLLISHGLHPLTLLALVLLGLQLRDEVGNYYRQKNKDYDISQWSDVLTHIAAQLKVGISTLEALGTVKADSPAGRAVHHLRRELYCFGRLDVLS